MEVICDCNSSNLDKSLFSRCLSNESGALVVLGVGAGSLTVAFVVGVGALVGVLGATCAVLMVVAGVAGVEALAWICEANNSICCCNALF